MAQPQIQKKYLTLRPIISDIGGPTHALSRHLANLLFLFIGMNPSFIKDSCYLLVKFKTPSLMTVTLWLVLMSSLSCLNFSFLKSLTSYPIFFIKKPLIWIEFVLPQPYFDLKRNSMNKLRAQPWDVVYLWLLLTFSWNNFENFVLNIFCSFP